MSANEPMHAPSPAEVRAALERILRSPSFEHAGRASEFLRFAVTETLAGRTDRLKGYTIARQVFGKPADFDAQSDPLVRVEALRLRQRLLEYYAREGSADAVRIELPRGGYVASVSYATNAADVIVPPPAQTAAPRSSVYAWAPAAALATVVLGSAVMLMQPLAEQSDVELRERSHGTRIVVVPIENLGSNGAFDRLAASLTEEILLRLAELDLFVVATQAQWYGTPSGRFTSDVSMPPYLLFQL